MEGAPEIFEDSSYSGMDSGGVTALLEASTWLLSWAGGSSQHVPRNVAGSDDEMLKKSQGEIAMMGLDR